MLLPSSSQCVGKGRGLYNVSSRGPSGQPSGTVAPKWTSTKPTGQQRVLIRRWTPGISALWRGTLGARTVLS